MTTPTLRITSERLVGSWPHPTGEDPRNQTAYCVAYYDNFFGVDILAYLGGWTDRPDQANTPIGSPDRIADKYRWATRLHGTLDWTDRGLMIGAAQFPWNLLPADKTPAEWRVGSCGGGQFFVEGDTLFFVCAASIEDPNCSTGEHDPTHTLTNGYGLISPLGLWSYFVVYRFELKATGIDATTMRIRSSQQLTDVSNFALVKSHFAVVPAADKRSGTFKGISNVRGVVPMSMPDGSQARGYWCELWRTSGLRQFVARESQGGALIEAWNGNGWDLIDSALWLNGTEALPNLPQGTPWDRQACHVVATNYFPGSRLVALATDRQHITWALSSDLTGGWQTQGTIAPMPSGVVGSGPQKAVDPHIAFVEGKPVLFVSVRVDGPQDTYAGLQVWECELQADGLPIAPPDPRPDPQPVALPYPYTVPQTVALDETLLTVAHGYKLGDQWFVAGAQFIVMPGGQTPLFGTWTLKGVVVR